MPLREVAIPLTDQVCAGRTAVPVPRDAPELDVARLARRGERVDRMRDLGRALAMQRRREPERAPWPDHWFSGGCDPSDAERCRRLWAAVLAQCVAAAVEDRRLTLRTGARMHAGPHWDWIGGREFAIVADLAGHDGEALASRLLAAGDSVLALTRILAAQSASRRMVAA